MLKFSDYSKIPGIKINENVVKVGNTFKVTLTYDVPLSIVKEYIDKIKSETGKNALEQFGAEHIAEQMMLFTLNQYMTVDNLQSSAIVGETQTSSDTAPSVAETDSAAETPKTEEQPTEPKESEEKADGGTEVDFETKKEEEEEESNYLNLYTTMGNPVATGFKIQPIAQKTPKNAKVGLHESLTDEDLK